MLRAPVCGCGQPLRWRELLHGNRAWSGGAGRAGFKHRLRLHLPGRCRVRVARGGAVPEKGGGKAQAGNPDGTHRTPRARHAASARLRGLLRPDLAGQLGDSASAAILLDVLGLTWRGCWARLECAGALHAVHARNSWFCEARHALRRPLAVTTSSPFLAGRPNEPRPQRHDPPQLHISNTPTLTPQPTTHEVPPLMLLLSKRIAFFSFFRLLIVSLVDYVWDRLCRDPHCHGFGRHFRQTPSCL